jgi:hypothetical protein
MYKKCPACKQADIDLDDLEKDKSPDGFECPACHSRLKLFPFLDTARYIFIHFAGLLGVLLFFLGYTYIAITLCILAIISAYSITRIWPINIINKNEQ